MELIKKTKIVVQLLVLYASYFRLNFTSSLGSKYNFYLYKTEMNDSVSLSKYHVQSSITRENKVYLWEEQNQQNFTDSF